MCFMLPLWLMKSNNIIIQWGGIWVPCTQADATLKLQGLEKLMLPNKKYYNQDWEDSSFRVKIVLL